MRKTGLLGRHISYSRSPEIHERLFRNKGLEIGYEIFDLPREDIQHFIDTLTSNEIIGFNVTIPYKEYIMGYIHELDSTALNVGAVNTVVIKNGWRIGYNTDVHGFMRSVKDNHIDVKGRRVLILGSGGAARAVYSALQTLGAVIDMAFRSEARKKEFPKVSEFKTLTEVGDLSPYLMVINATKLGSLEHDEMPIVIENYSSSTVLYDLNYNPMHSKFLRFGTEHGLQIINGESMLVNQAMKAQELWIDALKLF